MRSSSARPFCRGQGSRVAGGPGAAHLEGVGRDGVVLLLGDVQPRRAGQGEVAAQVPPAHGFLQQPGGRATCERPAGGAGRARRGPNAPRGAGAALPPPRDPLLGQTRPTEPCSTAPHRAATLLPPRGTGAEKSDHVPQPSASPPRGAVVSHLRRSCISAGDQEEPYRVSCHCFRVPGLRLSSPGEQRGWISWRLRAELASPQDVARSCCHCPTKGPGRQDSPMSLMTSLYTPCASSPQHRTVEKVQSAKPLGSLPKGEDNQPVRGPQPEPWGCPWAALAFCPAAGAPSPALALTSPCSWRSLSGTSCRWGRRAGSPGCRGGGGLW